MRLASNDPMLQIQIMSACLAVGELCIEVKRHFDTWKKIILHSNTVYEATTTLLFLTFSARHKIISYQMGSRQFSA